MSDSPSDLNKVDLSELYRPDGHDSNIDEAKPPKGGSAISTKTFERRAYEIIRGAIADKSLSDGEKTIFAATAIREDFEEAIAEIQADLDAKVREARIDEHKRLADVISRVLKANPETALFNLQAVNEFQLQRIVQLTQEAKS